MHRSTKIVIGIIILQVAALGYVGWAISRHGFSARAKPTWLEAMMARNARRIAIPATAKKLKDPYPITPGALEEARKHWADHCAVCHGLDGSGKTLIGSHLYPPAPDMRSADVQDETDGALFYIISNGVRFTGMPAWRSSHNAEETWNLVAFIRHLPKLTPEELKEMQRMMPQQLHEMAPEKPEAGEQRHGHHESH